MAPRTEPDWAAVKADYCAGERPIKDIAAHHGISPSRIHRRCKQEGWPLRSPGSAVAGRAELIRRMFRVLERQLNLLDIEMEEAGNSEVQLLGTMVKTLDKLIELDRGERKTEASTRSRAEMDAIKQRVARRIAELDGQ